MGNLWITVLNFLISSKQSADVKVYLMRKEEIVNLLPSKCSIPCVNCWNVNEMLMCAFQIPFFGFLRCAEFTIRNYSDHYGNIVCMQDIVFSSYTESYTLLLRGSKTDSFRQGVPIFINSNHVLCQCLQCAIS